MKSQYGTLLNQSGFGCEMGLIYGKDSGKDGGGILQPCGADQVTILKPVTFTAESAGRVLDSMSNHIPNMH